MTSPLDPIGRWTATGSVPVSEARAAREILGELRAPVAVLDGPSVASSGRAQLGEHASGEYPLLAYLPRMQPESLGGGAFAGAHGLRFPYMTGAMANGIASAEIVEAMARAGMLGSFGAAGLSVGRVALAVERLQANLGSLPFCINLIHSPNETGHEMALVELFLARGVTRIEASAYLDLTPAVVRYRVAGLSRGANGGVEIGNRIIAKVSRVEVASKFLSPAAERILVELLAANFITAEQSELARLVPMCDDLTAEADSGGHTDNRPAITLLPTMTALRDRLRREFNFEQTVRVGLAGGIATPASVAGAFALGASYVCTGSVNQACVESGSSDAVRGMLATAGQADVAMAPAADMFEMGVKLQVLKRGTMFPMRAQKLFDLYRAYPNWEAIPEAERVPVEKTILRRTFDDVWAETREFFSKRDPAQVPKAEANAKHKMALVFRWYLGLSSRWANAGDPSRQLDYQVWCGPAMGAFNEWAKGSHLEQSANRTVVHVAHNLLFNACVVMRQTALRNHGIELPGDWFPTGPRTEFVI